MFVLNFRAEKYSFLLIRIGYFLPVFFIAQLFSDAYVKNQFVLYSNFTSFNSSLAFTIFFFKPVL